MSKSINFRNSQLGNTIRTEVPSLFVDTSGIVFFDGSRQVTAFTGVFGVGAGTIDGSGTTNFIPLFTDFNTLANSVIIQSGSRIGIGTDNPLTAIHIVAPSGNEGTVLSRTLDATSFAGHLIRNKDDINVGSFQYGNASVGDVSLRNLLIIGSRESGVAVKLYQGKDAGQTAFKPNNERIIFDVDGNTILTAASDKLVEVSGVTFLIKSNKDTPTGSNVSLIHVSGAYTIGAGQNNLGNDYLADHTQVNIINDGTLFRAKAHYTDFKVTSSGTVNAVYGYDTNMLVPTATTLVGQRIVANSTGNVGNVYGIWLKSLPTGTSNTYGIYENNSHADNYFAGNVGIGTATPAHKLDVIGMGRFVHADGVCGLMVEDTAGSGVHIGDCAYSNGATYAGIKHSKHTGSAEYMMISQGDHTFISAASGSPVIIRGGANNTKCELRVYDNNDGENGVVINEGGFDRDTRIEGISDQNLFKVDASADSIGIGTNSPAYKLDIVGTFSADSVNVNNAYTFPTGDGTAGHSLVTDGAGNIIFSGVTGGFTETISSGDPVSFLVNDVPYAISGSHISVTAASSSNNSGSRFIQDILLDNNGHVTGINTALATGTGGTGSALSGQGTANYVTKWLDADTVGTGIIFDNDNVGIGTNSPVSRLDVRNGDILVGSKLVVGSGVYSQTSPGAYFGLKHTDLTDPSEYMIMSAGTHTYLSAKEYSDVIIRGGGNKVDHQIVVTESGITLGKYRPAASSVVAEHDVELVYDDGGCVRIADRGGSGVMIGDCALDANTTYAGMKHTSMAGSNDYMMVSDGTDTFISAANNNHVFIRGGGNSAESQISVLDVGAGSVGIVLNENGSDRDIRMEGASDTNLFRLDASSDNIGIGTVIPQAKLHVQGGPQPFMVGNTGVNTLPFFVIRGGSAAVTAAFGPATSPLLGGAFDPPDSCRMRYYSTAADNNADYWSQESNRRFFRLTPYITGGNPLGTALRISTSGALTLNEAFTLPISDGSNGQVLVTNGAGNVDWSGVTSHPSISSASSSDNSGRTYIQDILLDSNGHVTGIATATETVTDTNTTYTAGSGLSLSGTTFNAVTATTNASGIVILTNTINASQNKALTPKAVNDAGYLTAHPSISAASTSDNSGRTYIQDIGLDSNGHVTSIATATETVTDTNTTYSAGSGLSLSGTTFNLEENVLLNTEIQAGSGINLIYDSGNGTLTINRTSENIGNLVTTETVGGRLTLESGVPVSTSGLTAQTNLYFTPCISNNIALYNGSEWNGHTFNQLELSLSGYTADKNFDIFVHATGGTPVLESLVWTNDTTRATALTTQDGVYVKNGAATRRYLGTIRTTSSTGQCEDSEDRRFVWSYYNQVKKRSEARLAYGIYTYATQTWRSVKNSTTVGETRYEFVVGLDTYATTSHNHHHRYMYSNVVFDSTTGGSSAFVLYGHNGDPDYPNTSVYARGSQYLSPGFHFAQAIEFGINSNSGGFEAQLEGDMLC